MCSNVSYEQLRTIHLDTLHTLLESSCNLTTHNDLMLNLTNPIDSTNVLLHDHNINIITNEPITCRTPLNQHAEEYHLIPETENSSDKTFINNNAICYKTINETCENDQNNIVTYATIHQTLNTFCPATYESHLQYNITDSENEIYKSNM